MLAIRDFEKRYHDRLILHVKNLPLKPGITWIKGENGSGKSTFFKSVSGLIPSSGSFVFDDGLSLHKDPIAYRSRINYSEAEPFYPSFLSASELIQFVAAARKAPRGQQQHYIDAFGIGAFMHDPCGSYSSGMLKKVSLVIAFLGSPSVIILDEPLITLDTTSQQNLTRLIEEKINNQNDLLFLVSSHQQFETSAISTTYSISNQTLILS